MFQSPDTLNLHILKSLSIKGKGKNEECYTPHTTPYTLGRSSRAPLPQQRCNFWSARRAALREKMQDLSDTLVIVQIDTGFLCHGL
jgi:hypothetical protein